MVNHNCGEQAHQAKLTEAQVNQIRFKAKYGTQREIAREYGVTQQMVSLIVNRKNWRHI